MGKMAKHRKTRQEKMIADQRHVVYHLESNSAQASSPIDKKSDVKMSIPTVQAHTVSYNHVTHDLRKTAMVTAVVIIAQIILLIVINGI